MRPLSATAASDVERAIAIERRDLDRDDALDVQEGAPERRVEDAAADGRLKVEADHGDDLGDRAAMLEQRRVVGIFQRGEAQQRRVVAESRRQFGFVHRLRLPADHAGDHQRPRPARFTPLACGSHRELEDRLQQAHFRFPDLELRGVDRDGEASGAGVAVVAGQRNLPPFVERALARSAPADAPE